MSALIVFRDASIGAAAVAVVAFSITAIRSLSALRGLIPAVQALCRVQPYLILATRKQNSALRELGANGSTVESDKHLDDAQGCLDALLVDRVGACK